MFDLYFTDKAYEAIDRLSNGSRNIINDLYEHLLRLEREGIPEGGRPIPGLIDADGQPVKGYVAEMGKFTFVVSREGKHDIIVWGIQLRAVDEMDETIKR